MHFVQYQASHQPHQGDQDMGTTLSCKKDPKGASLICMVGEKVVSLPAAVILSLNSLQGASLRGIYTCTM